MKFILFFLVLSAATFSVIASELTALAKLKAELNALTVKENTATKRYELESKAIHQFQPLTTACGRSDQYQQMFELAVFVRGGVATQEHIGEIISLSAMACSETFLLELSSTQPEWRNATLEGLGITPPPWEVAEKLHPFIHDARFAAIMDDGLRKWIEDCTDSDGRQKIYCNWK